MESKSASRLRPGVRFRQRCGSLLRRATACRVWQRGLLFVVLLLSMLLSSNSGLPALVVLFPPSQPKPAAAPGLTPMTQDQALANQANAWGHTSGTQQTLAQFLATGPHTTPLGATIPRQVVTPAPAATGSVTLNTAPTKTTVLTTSDGRFTLALPAGALTASDLAKAGGPITIQVTELAGPVGGGASGHINLGTYRIELLGPHGRITGLAFHQPLRLGLQYAASEAGAFINNGISLNLESDSPQHNAGVVTTAPVGGASQPTREHVPTTLLASQRTITGQSLLAPMPLTGALVATYNTNAPQANWPTVQDFQTDLNSGSLNYSYPFTLPPAPGNFVPTLGLSYSSATVNEDHGLQTSAPWVGEGWALDLGSINWSQIDENSGCQQAAPPPPYNPNCGSHNWQNTWTISASGISGSLIPQNITWATGTNAAGDQEPTRPALWYTAPESHAKIVMYDCTTTDLQNNAWTHPCWRVWLPSGEMMEFGATSDSVEYYLDASDNKYLYSWKVDALVDTHGNQIHVSYQQYTAPYSSTDATKYVRDAELLYVSYDSPTCQNTSTICPTTGSAPNLWQPLVQVKFDQGTKPTRSIGSDTPCTNWSSSATTRCDTAPDYPGGLPGPQVTSLGILDAVEVQVRPTTSSNFAVLRAYALSYEQGGVFSGLFDSISGEPEYGAGYTDLVKIQEFGTDWTGDSSNTGTSWPAMTFAYSGHWSYTPSCLSGVNFPCTDSSILQERYIDPAYIASPSSTGYAQCIPWVNFGGCYSYSYSETLNQRYLTEVDNGMGWQETFSWQEGHMNVVGVPSGQSVTSPFGCTASSMNAFPCWEADEQHWSRVLLVARDANVQRTTLGASQPITVDHHFAYTYTLTTVQSGNNWCISGVCTVVWDFGNVNDGDYLDYYNSEYRGFTQVHVLEQEIDTGGGSCTTACTIAQSDHSFITTQGWGVWNTNEVTSQQGCWNAEGTNPVQYLCPTSPYWSASNMPAGRETKVDQYASNGTTLLTETDTIYTLDCGPKGDPTTPSRFDSNWWTINPGVNNTHLLVAELDQSNPIAVCDPQVSSVQTFTVDGGSLSSAPSTTVTYSYDTNQSYSSSHDYGNVTVVDTVASDGGSVGGSGNDMVQTTDYTVNDNITMTSTSATGTYLVDAAYQSATRSGSATGTIQALTQDYYDGNTSLTAAPTTGEVTEEDVASSGTGPYTFLVTKDGYDSYGNLVGILKPNGQTGCTVGSTSYSSCATYDTASYTAHVTKVTDALGQSMAWNLGTGIAFGYGQWLQNNTDANNQVTSYQYDALARLIGIIDPGETTNDLTVQYVYSIWCQATGPSIPCSEMDTIQRYDSNTTVDSRVFYDGWGKAAETRVPADSNNDVVTYITYDAREDATFTSRPYYVSAYTGGPGGTASTNAYSAPDSTQLGSSAVYDALGRTIQATDPAGATTTTSYLQATGPDGATYLGTQVIDANAHQGLSLTDALGRTRYEETFTGTGPYTLYSTTSQAYDFQGNVVAITHPDGTHTTTNTYDLAGRQTGQSDPDLGSITMQRDADGNVISQTDARGQTVYLGYDALDRELWRNTTNSPTGAYSYSWS